MSLYPDLSKYGQKVYVDDLRDLTLFEPRLMGFSASELAKLKRVMDEQDWPFDRVLNVLRLHAARERSNARWLQRQQQEYEWREYFGVLAELWG